MKLLIIGPQASGKGTQADLIAKRLGVPHLSSGDLLREEKRSGSPLGNEIAALIDKGELLPDMLVWEMIRKRLAEHPEGWVLDGFPRTTSQAAMLDAYQTPEKVVLLDVQDAVCIDRITGRRVCAACGKDYHIKYKPPKREGVCDNDGKELVQRGDDHPDAVRRRLADYHAKTEPLLHRYQDRLIKIKGDQGIQEVWAEIRKRMGI